MLNWPNTVEKAADQDEGASAMVIDRAGRPGPTYNFSPHYVKCLPKYSLSTKLFVSHLSYFCCA